MSILRYDLPLVISCIIFTGWCALLINAFNLIDGLCSGLVLVSLFVIAGLEFANGRESTAVMMLTMAAAVGGFMRFNLNPAKIFLGDAGSMMLVFFLATSATQIGGEKVVVGSIMLPIAIAGVSLLDVLLAVWRRSARGHLPKSNGEEQNGGIFTADKDHLHHRFLVLGLTQRKVAYVLYRLAVLLAVLCFIPMMVAGRVVPPGDLPALGNALHEVLSFPMREAKRRNARDYGEHYFQAKSNAQKVATELVKQEKATLKFSKKVFQTDLRTESKPL